MPKKNHILEALSELHDLVDCFPGGVENLLEQYDDGESHTKKNAGVVASGHIDGLVDQLNNLKAEIQKKYR